MHAPLPQRRGHGQPTRARTDDQRSFALRGTNGTAGPL